MDLLAVILFFWALWLAKRPGAPAWLRFIAPSLAVVFVLSLSGTAFALRAVFMSSRLVEAADRAEYLAEGIRRAMVFTACGLVFDVVVAAVLATFTWRLRSRRG